MQIVLLNRRWCGTGGQENNIFEPSENALLWNDKQNTTLNETSSTRQKQNKKIKILNFKYFFGVLSIYLPPFVVWNFTEVFFRKRLSCRECL